MNYGFIKVAAAVPNVKVADCSFNEMHIENLVAQAEGKGVEIICFPELSMTGYTCGDLFAQQLLLDSAENALFRLLDFTRSLNIITIIGMPVQMNSTLINSAVLIQGGKILGIVPKTYLPNYKEFYEKRWFTSALDHESTNVHICGQNVPVSRNIIFNTTQGKFAVELCEDMWAPIPPSSELALRGAEIIFNLSADNEGICKHKYVCSLIAQQSARCIAGYVFSSCGFGESTQDVVFAGNGIIYENGLMLAHSKRFSFEEQLVITEIDVEKIRAERRMNSTFGTSVGTLSQKDTINVDCTSHMLGELKLTRKIDPHPFVPTGAELDERCEEIFAIQVQGLAQRIVHTNAATVVLGISGGLDSTLALLVCAKTMDKLKRKRKDIIGVTMPGFGTTDRTYHNAISLMQSLGITIKEISIKDACIQHFKDIGHNIDVQDVTYENAQARERTQILMDLANKFNGFVVGTGDLSELALGWATYNADHMSNYGVNCSIPKTLVKHLVTWVAQNSIDEESKATLLDIVDTPISPELIPADKYGNIQQKTEDLVGPYELHDFFLYNFIRFGFSPSKIYFLAQQAFNSNEGITAKYDDSTIKKWLTTFCRRFFTQQFKRSCLPDGPKVGSVSLSPRGDWRMPSDASYAMWVSECEAM
ncbi:MAG: NAD(+) synthase [Bacteroides sp. 43_108]|nr:MAG: NAD(+) synthase [Bacteroides sp. 43_108]